MPMATECGHSTAMCRHPLASRRAAFMKLAASRRAAWCPSLDCREGCSYCCCKPGVLTTVPELLRILEHVRSTSDAGALETVAARARRYAWQLKGRRFDDLVDESIPCPLLVDGRCSVYEV